MKSKGVVCACRGQFAVALLGNGCPRLLMRVVLITLVCSTCSTTDTRYAGLYCKFFG